jgi:Protein of unknown function (DUF2971)
MPSPRLLYKYLSPARVDFLSSGMLRFTPLGAFNDPFEDRPEITQVLTETELADSIEDLLQDEANSAYARLPESVRSAVTRDTFIALMRSAVQQNESQIQAGIAAVTPHFVHAVQSKFDELIGALCLSEVPDSLLMWAHYASSHTGVAIEFDAANAYFDSRRTPEDEFGHLKRVLYRDTRPSGSLTSMADELFTVKSTHWSYEREWRILQPLPNAARVVPAMPFPIHLFELPLKSVTAVIIGARATPETQAAVRESIRRNPDLRFARLKRARPDGSHFLLHIEAA